MSRDVVSGGQAPREESKVILHYKGEVATVTVLSVTSRGQVTFRREVLQHLGIMPGDKIEIDLLPGAKAQLSASRPQGSPVALRGILAEKTNGARLSVEQIDAAIAQAGADAGAGVQ